MTDMTDDEIFFVQKTAERLQEQGGFSRERSMELALQILEQKRKPPAQLP